MATQLSRLTDLIGAIGTDWKNFNTRIGNLASLTTTDKASLVAAINELQTEVNAAGGGGGVAGSALPVMGTLDGTEHLLGIQSGVTEKVLLSALKAFIDQRQVNASVANQAFSNTEVYIAGSNVAIPDGKVQVGTFYRMRMQIAKTTANGTATPIVNVRIGTAGAIGDTSRAVLTFAAQTAAIDDGFLEVFVTFRTVGASAVISVHSILDHKLAATGLQNTNTGFAKAVSAAFASNVSGLKIGCTFTGGTQFTGNTDLVQAEIGNLI